MGYSKLTLCQIIDAIDITLDFLIKDEESYNEIFVDGSEVQVTHGKLMDLRNDAEKMLFLSIKNSHNKEES